METFYYIDTADIWYYSAYKQQYHDLLVTVIIIVNHFV